MADIKNRFPSLPQELVDALDIEVSEPDPPRDAFTGSLTLEWEWDTGTTDADPGTGKVRGNDPTQASISEFFINDESSNGKDVSTLLTKLDNGDVIIFTEEQDTSRWIIADVTGSTTDAATYFKIPVSISQTGNPVRNKRLLAVQLVFT